MSDDFYAPDSGRYDEILGRQDYPNVHTKVVIKRDGTGWESKTLPGRGIQLTAKEILSVMNAVTDPHSYPFAKIEGIDYNVHATPQGEYVYGIGQAYRGSKTAFCTAKAGNKMAMVIGSAGTDSAVQTMCMNAQDLGNRVAQYDSTHPGQLDEAAPALDEGLLGEPQDLASFSLEGVAAEEGASGAWEGAEEGAEEAAAEDFDWC